MGLRSVVSDKARWNFSVSLTLCHASVTKSMLNDNANLTMGFVDLASMTPRIDAYLFCGDEDFLAQLDVLLKQRGASSSLRERHRVPFSRHLCGEPQTWTASDESAAHK